MRFARTYVLAFFSLLLAFPVFAQQPSTSTTQSSPQALALLQKSLAALTGGQPITDVRLTGTARRIAGSDDESGTAVLKAFAPGPAKQETTGQSSTTTVQRDPQAVAILQESVAAMAATVPVDSSASGTVTVVEGSTTQEGTIQILTLGATQTSETLNLPAGQRAVIYSNGASKEIFGTQSSSPPMQSVLSDQSVDFPIAFLTAALGTSDESVRYIGNETLNGQTTQHVQLWNSFASKPHLQSLAPFSLKDVWVDANSGLPLKISYFRRTSGGMAPAIPVEVFLSKYTNVSGVLYPFQIDKSKNGTPWQTITIQNVSFNTGLSAAQFQVE